MKVSKKMLTNIVGEYNYLLNESPELLEGYKIALKTMDIWNDVQYELYYNQLNSTKKDMLKSLRSLIEKVEYKFDITLLDEYYEEADYYNLPEDERKAIKGKIYYIYNM